MGVERRHIRLEAGLVDPAEVHAKRPLKKTEKTGSFRNVIKFSYSCLSAADLRRLENRADLLP